MRSKVRTGSGIHNRGIVWLLLKPLAPAHFPHARIGPAANCAFCAFCAVVHAAIVLDSRVKTAIWKVLIGRAEARLMCSHLANHFNLLALWTDTTHDTRPSLPQRVPYLRA